MNNFSLGRGGSKNRDSGSETSIYNTQQNEIEQKESEKYDRNKSQNVRSNTASKPLLHFGAPLDTPKIVFRVGFN